MGIRFSQIPKAWIRIEIDVLCTSYSDVFEFVHQVKKKICVTKKYQIPMANYNENFNIPILTMRETA